MRAGPPADPPDFLCQKCGAPVDFELEMDGDKVRSVRFPCRKCGLVGTGARVAVPNAKAKVTVEARP